LQLLTPATAGAKIPAMDDANRYQRLRAMFDDALRKEPPARQAYVDAVCRNDPALHSELLRLLGAHERATSFMERPAGVLPPLPGEDFSGTGRFTVLRRLGAGGMGVVYEAQDLARNEIVALKTLRHASPLGVYRLKQEFRSLAGVAHPNLVCLYDLIVEAGECFFTMELVKGVSIVDYIREGARISESIDRLRSVLPQLVNGVAALHRLGKLHRDIKPSNVLVTPQERVVILDFGLITEFSPGMLGGAEHVVGGTPAYISPEESFGEPPSEAGDWYSVGATIYEALTGRIPFTGPAIEVLLRKRECDPPPPAQLVPEVPADLSSICMGLLCRDPAREWRKRDLERRRLAPGLRAEQRSRPGPWGFRS
jgi:serine/threonine protein kinase